MPEFKNVEKISSELKDQLTKAVDDLAGAIRKERENRQEFIHHAHDLFNAVNTARKNLGLKEYAAMTQFESAEMGLDDSGIED